MTTTYDNLIEQIVQSGFSTMLNLDLFRAETSNAPDHESLFATIHIAGAWTGSVVLSLSPEVALQATSAMLGLPESEVTETERQEVAVELANMIGGNLKSLLPAPSYLSLPTIVAGREFYLQVRDAELLEDVFMACEAGLLRTRLFARRAE